MVWHISKARLRLINHYQSVSKTTRIKRSAWSAGLTAVLGVRFSFLAFQSLLGLPLAGIRRRR